MHLICRLVDNITHYGNTKVYLFQKNALKYICYRFHVIDGYLTIIKEEHYFDKALWDGEHLNKKAHKQEERKVLEYSANPLIVEHLGTPEVFDERLNSILALILARALTSYGIDIECFSYDIPSSLDETFEAGRIVSDKIIKMCDLTNQELTEFIDSTPLEIAHTLKSKADNNKMVFEHKGSPTAMTSRYFQTIFSSLKDIEFVDKEIKRAENALEFKNAISVWRSLCLDRKPLIKLPEKENGKER